MSEYIAIMMVRWMSGLVTGLQNRLQRFESASDLQNPFYTAVWRGFTFFTPKSTLKMDCISCYKDSIIRLIGFVAAIPIYYSGLCLSVCGC